MRFLFRMILIIIAIVAIMFGVWYYMTNQQISETIHGTLVWEKHL